MTPAPTDPDSGARPQRRSRGVPRWLAAHPFAADALLAAALVVATGVLDRQSFAQPFDLVFHFAMLVPLAWRRRAPFVVFWVLTGVLCLQWLLLQGGMVADLAILVALGTIAAHYPLRRALAAGAVVAALIVGQELHYYLIQPAIEVAEVAVGLCGLAAAAVMSGAYLRSHRAYLTALEAHAAHLARDRDQRAQLAVAQERARIAREMHDVVTHSLSVMVTLADGAAIATDRAPDKAKRAIGQAAATGRQALIDMRRFLDVLRADEPDAQRHPQPGIAQLDALTAQVRAAGLPVRLRVTGPATELGVTVQLTVYRVVQECLTNTLKHAAPGAHATVCVTCAPEQVTVEVADNGSALNPVAGAGHGIEGMRDRVAAYGGTLTAGPLPGGGWRVTARLNLGEAQ